MTTFIQIFTLITCTAIMCAFCSWISYCVGYYMSHRHIAESLKTFQPDTRLLLSFVDGFIKAFEK